MRGSDLARATSAATRAISLPTIIIPSSTPMPGLASTWIAPHAIAMCADTCADRSVSLQLPPQYAAKSVACDEEQRLDGVVDASEVRRLHVDDICRLRGNEDLDVLEGVAPLIDGNPHIAVPSSQRSRSAADTRTCASRLPASMTCSTQTLKGRAVSPRRVRYPATASISPPNATPMVPYTSKCNRGT